LLISRLFQVNEAEEMLSDEPDNMWSASDTEFQSDNDDSFITQSDDLRFETELQQLRDRKPDESEFALEQSSSRKKWPRMDKEPVNVEEPIVKVIDVKRVTEESISRPVVCRNLPAVRMTHAVNGSSDGRSRMRRAYIVVLPRPTLADRLIG
jgi:3'-phosphoadenosine 5'-phosphosulfate (PAPS) 3'-phosphatase